MELSIPQEGFATNAVHRLLVTFGRGNHLKAVPMAILVEPVALAEEQEPK